MGKRISENELRLSSNGLQDQWVRWSIAGGNVLLITEFNASSGGRKELLSELLTLVNLQQKQLIFLCHLTKEKQEHIASLSFPLKAIDVQLCQKWFKNSETK